MRAQRVTRLAAVSAVGMLMAGGAAIGAAGTASAANPAVRTHVTTNWCGDRGDRGGSCFDHRFDGNGFRFDDRFDHNGFRFDHRFDHHGFRFDDRFDHHGFFVNRGGVLIFVF